ncbi:MAG: carbohydate-binding domain-containing protein, partial [Bacteroidales bacterium]|nr:carbohydate-binding domain-containing protein [Bacteroidales bacterium]
MKKTIFFVLGSFLVLSCSNMTKSDYPAGNEIVLEWEFLGNNISESYFSSVFTLENRSGHTLGNSGWAIYFNQMGQGVIRESVSGNVRIDHINGDLVRILPSEDFKLEPGQTVEISFNKPGWLIKKNESPLGPYMVYTDDKGDELAVQAIEQYKIKPFPPLDVIYPSESSVPLPDADWVYEQNLHQILQEPGNSGRIIPTPVKEVYSGKNITLKKGLMIHYNEGLSREAEYLARMLEEVMGTSPLVMQGSESGPHIISLISDKAKVMGDEAYQMVGNGESGVMITGRSPAGVFYGIQSLLSMLPVKVWEDPMAQIDLESFMIHDGPAFEYRGMHLDIARNFLEPEAIKKLIRVMAFYKMNKLHLHLTDDEGWRL